MNKQEAGKVPKTIAVLLDLEGTSDFINDEKAKLFIQQLDLIREKFGADLGTISISTHFHDSSDMKRVLEILSRNTTENIKIGLNFYYGGVYNFDENIDIPQDYNFNQDKVGTFDYYYVNNNELENKWFALIDDGMMEDVYKKYQHTHPMLLCRPSKQESELKCNCFMSISTMKKGFDGVLEAFNIYIDSIKELDPNQILETQKEMLVHLHGYEINEKVWKRDYSFVYRYFKAGFADAKDYSDVLNLIIFTIQRQAPTKEELIQIKNILVLMDKQFQSNNDGVNIEKVKELKSVFCIFN